MGMKDLTQLLLANAMMLGTDLPFCGENDKDAGLDDYRGIDKKPKSKQILFNNSESVLKLIREYKEIMSGVSKKQPRKQTRIKSKIENWLAEGKLTKEDLK